jgi:metal-responsive CopG/Arc/MetJ family transcriptional regulator
MKIKTSITLSKDLLEEIDTIVEDSTSRSNFIEEALRNHLERRRRLRREKTDLKIINRSADRLNKEAQDVLSYQVDL